jgi:ferredoxin
MGSSWQSCPHCKVHFSGREGTGLCPSCGKSLAPNSPKAEPVWWYAQDKQRLGPFSAAQMRALASSGALFRTDMVLPPGTRQWLPAGDVMELFPAAAPSPVEPVRPCAGSSKRAAEITSRHEARAEGQVVPEAERCVQCGCCSYNCPIGIDVRAHAWRGLAINDSHCLTCGECVKRCPRGVLRFERISLRMTK